LTHPINNYLPSSTTKGICAESQLNCSIVLLISIAYGVLLVLFAYSALLVLFAYGALLVPFAYGVLLVPFAYGALLVPFAYRALLIPFAYGTLLMPFAYGALLILFAHGAAYCITVSVDSTGTGNSTGQDPETIKKRAMLYAHIPFIPVSNGVGLGSTPCR
jgi:hypothetical protein